MTVPRALGVFVLIGLLSFPLGTVHAAVVGSVFGGKVSCSIDASTVQFCEGSVTTRVESWDGVPIDVNVTLPPASMTGPFPLIIELHGWSGSKASGPSVDRALAGYVVLDYSARGFHESCGFPSSRTPEGTLSDPNACNDRGWTHLGDARYEGRDSQYLAGILVDEGHVIPNKIGATGASYGGGRSMILAALKNRVMLPDGSLIPWQSPGGTPMEIAATAPLIPWSDLAYSLVPNGATLDYRDANPYGERGGVQKQQWNGALFSSGLTTGFYAPEGTDPTADLIGWDNRITAGEPYDGDPFVQGMLEEITQFHSAYYIDDSTAPAPMFIYNAWTDDLFPASEALRMWRKVKAAHPSAELNLFLADAFGHPRASLGISAVSLTVFARVQDFLDFHLLGVGSPIPSLEVYTQACGGSTESGPISAADWDAIHPGEVVHVDTLEQSIDETSGDPVIAAGLAPLAGSACRTIADAIDPTAATYDFPAATGSGYTLVGSPTIIADYAVTGAEYAQIAARLWDVDTGGNQSLISHGFYRPRGDNLGPQVFQLPAHGWEFAPGHKPRLELVGSSATMGRVSNGTFTVRVKSMEVRLPVIEAPDGGQIGAPGAPVFPSTEPEAPACPPTPATSCRAPVESGKSKLSVSAGKTPEKQKMSWRWKKGDATDAADFGAGVISRGYALCMYDGNDELLMSTKAPTSGTCGDDQCWTIKNTSKSTKYDYKDKKLVRTGTKKVQLRPGEAGKASIKVQGKGIALGVPSLPVGTLPIEVQLINHEGDCWGATFSTVRKNDASKLKANSD